MPREEIDDPPVCIRCNTAPAAPLRTRCAPCQLEVELSNFAIRNAPVIAAIRADAMET